MDTKTTLHCPTCQKPHTYATGMGPSPEPGDLVVCAYCYAVSQLRTPGPRLDYIDEKSLDTETKTEVERYRTMLRQFKAESPS